MRSFFHPTKPYLFFIRVSFVYFFIQFMTRVILILMGNDGFISSLHVLVIGFFWDLAAWSVLGIPLYLVSAFFHPWLKKDLSYGFLKYSISIVITFILSFVSFCELTFWDEFHSRFNFIAVDYLIYTNEVVANIQESFPMGIIIPVIFLISMLLSWIVFKLPIPVTKTPLLKRFPSLVLFIVITPIFFNYFIVPNLENFDQEFRNDQLAKNGWIEFFRAFQSNHIDFNSFYKTVDPEVARNVVLSKKLNDHTEKLANIGSPNVVIIVVESLGAKFIGPLNGQSSTTPNLNKLADESLFFENLYATGTRTVRGLEAINLSVPPTPGYAVVKRPKNKNLFSLGHTFKSNGYDPIFLYGGRGFFDNMNAFFEGNSFRTIDQTDFSNSEITFSNAWGVCDEDLFDKALRVMDEGINPKLLFVLTTSNHRPFTYPEGRIDIPSGYSRAGAVKYTDYSIGNFLKKAASKPWMKDTIFVIVADHSTEGRGRFSLEMADFHIPMWIYSPSLIKASRNKMLVSQIDILPSLIHLLGLRDNSPFFGRSFFDSKNFEERAFIGNYQYVGYYKENFLTTLGPNKKVRSYTYAPATKIQHDSLDAPFLNEAISYYQYANELLSTDGYRHKETLVTQKLLNHQ